MFGGIASTSLRYIASGLSVFAPSGNATVGDVGLTSRSNCSSAARELVADDRPHLLRLAVVRVVVAGRERVRAEHDPALRLVAEPRVARAHRTARGRRRRLDAQPVADAVVAGEVGRRLRRGRSGSSRAGRTRPSAGGSYSPTSAPSSRQSSIARVDGLAHARLDALGLVQLLRDADAQAASGPRASGISTGSGSVDRGRVVRVAAGDHRVEERAVARRSS